MEIEEIARFAKIKGLRLIGTGDFTHPKWLDEIKANLEPEAGTNLYVLANKVDASVRFMLTTEVCTIFGSNNETKKIHNGILTPSLETAVQINDVLKHYGDLKLDGRPLLEMTAAQLVEEVMSISDENFVFPAHIWTPWFSALGAFSGFDSIEECYQDMTKHIQALETGLSSDPPMNWRLSKLDKYTLISNSDSHSFWPWRIGREANVFEIEEISYHEVLDAVCKKDPERFRFTIETDPAYGKYHWTGHRKCNVSLSPQEADKIGNICPVCHRKLTEGVEQRVEKLADRPADFKPNNVPGFLQLLPLSEIIATVLGVESVSTQAVWKIYNLLISKFGDEYTVLMETPKVDLSEILEPSIADAILRARVGQVHVIPGYDGVYGKIDLTAPTFEKKQHNRRWQQSNLSDFN
jgi:uncharacterized protein (TIGR00375 family)